MLQGCIQAPSSTRKATVSSASTTASKGNTTTVPPTFAADENLYWYTTSKIIGTVTINKDSQDIIYLRGKSVNDFLNSIDINGTEYFRKQYCMVGNFSNNNTYKQVRVRAIPTYVTTSTKAIERILRIDIPSATDNSSACKFTTIDTILPATAAFSLPDICSTCSGQVTTTNLNLFEAQTSNLVKIQASQLNLSTMLLKVDLTSNSTDPNSSCTNSFCAAKGFDCCISGQCANDATEKTNASSDLQYTQAKKDYATNPLSFINYPNIFYICSNIAHIPPATTTPTTTTPTADALARVAKYLTDYTCISSPVSQNGVSTCLTYTATKKRLAIACGCTAADDQMDVKCPDWGVIPVYPAGALKTNANITDFTCYTPAPPNQVGPITNLNVSVPNRSSPHRFYSSNGLNYDDISGLNTKFPSTIQEGDDFFYLDEFNKIGPVNGSYNINSVIGKMTIDLSHALPAKVVTVELGKTYIVSATSGFFTPCAQCVKDSWFQSFSAYPSSKSGVGLQAVGYSTSRDTYSGNSTFGNYEDTKFGRACFVPVTMLALSHKKDAVLQTQRQNRLKTQAAYYINGYQRDWYGFNKDALIGSYDGVTWFAIGSGRRTTATSSKLFLALNASFLDLVDKTDTIVNIIPDFSANTAADYDYDPELSLTDPHQNTGASCQKFHQCNADADCVAQLGWEYVCTDASQVKTKWPVYNSDGLESTNQEITGSLFEILKDTISTSSVKRCVYRGAGAPCKRDYSSLTESTKKPLTCAPNFYCASLTTNKFNDELVRSPNELDDILYGMETNILGRPLNYVKGSKSLTAEIIANIKYNASSAIGLTSGASDDMGICRPGKFLSATALTAHGNGDASKRTDYISQIGSCDSTAIDTTRFVTCPSFDDNQNYAATVINQTSQNSCGGEAKHTNTHISAFKSIEGLPLLNLQNIDQPILAQDACLRRAGSICHSDLDCGPNKMHEDTVGSIDMQYFGGTEAEQSYWRESLICGQATATPTPGTAGYLTYNLSDNRCCREIGKNFSMVTQGAKSIVPENAGSNETLSAGKFTYKDPTAANRYSRYTISKTALGDPTTIPVVSTTLEPTKNQWKVVNETGSLTCCGGGWIRKFADGTHDWRVRKRLSLDATNFNCLNFRSPLADQNYSNFSSDNINSRSYQRDFGLLCKSPSEGGCLQIPYQPSSAFTILSPIPYDPSTKVKGDAQPSSGFTRLDTSPTVDPINGTIPWTQYLNSDVPYMPLPYYFTPIPYDLDPKTNKSYNFFTNRDFDYGVSFYLPSYISWIGPAGNGSLGFGAKVYIKYFYDAPRLPEYSSELDYASSADCANVLRGSTIPIDALGASEKYCVINDPLYSDRPIVNIEAAHGAGQTWKYAGVVIDFQPVEIRKSLKVSEPGNALYYLSKLARMELIGIPQITYEPLYCNNNQNNLVPGIFKSNIKTRSDFTTGAPTYSSDFNQRYDEDGSANTSDSGGYGNSERKFTYQDKVDHPAIFSSRDFTCCTPLGKTPTTAANCCSGFSAVGSAGTTICKMPKGTDLNVYFNKFVSSEGVGDAQPGGGLTFKGADADVDFNPYTGEPKYRNSTYDKLVALGNSYCDGGKVGTGGAFGAFPPEPFSGSYNVPSGATGNLEDSFPMSIVDSIVDFQTSDPSLGKVPFDDGFKWNHHYYCK